MPQSTLSRKEGLDIILTSMNNNGSGDGHPQQETKGFFYMFKSIQWKLVVMFVLLVISVMIVVGTVLMYNVDSFYHRSFVEKVGNVLSDKTGGLMPDVNKIMMNSSNESQQTLVEKLNQLLHSYEGMLGINYPSRNYYILDGNTGTVLEGPASESYVYKSSNVISALNGKPGNARSTEGQYMDYAVPIINNGKVAYIIYISDNKEELKSVQGMISMIVLQAILFGFLISLILGYLFSNTITKPIASLTFKAEKMAAGDFEHRIEVKSEDEIGKLTNTFNFMAKELKHTLEEIAREKNKVETILLYMTDGVMAFDLSGKAIHINPAAKRMMGIDRIEEVDFDRFFKAIAADITLGDLIYLDHWKNVEREIDINDIHIKAYFAAFKIEKDKSGGVIVVLQDVTEQQKLEASRREFVANVSHELRTPITTIKSYTETLLDGALEDKETATHFLTVVNNESDRMTRLVKDLLLLSKLEHTETAWMKTTFSLKQLIEEVVEKLSFEAKSFGHSLTFALTTEIPDIYADKDRIEQVIINIISNAIKYTPSGGRISVFAGCIYNEVYIKIVDNGVGIPKEDVPRIFERFYRVDKARSRELGGTGLGLAIAQEIIQAHHGSISIESEQGKGTEVIIKLPAPQEEQ